MTIQAQLADGRVLEFPDGTDPAVIQATVKRLVAGSAPAPKEGIMAALAGGAKRFGSTIETGLESIIDPNLAAQRGVARSEALGQEYAPATSLEKVKQAYAEKGLFPAAYEAISQIPGAISENLPNMGATVAGGRVGAMAGSAFGPVGALIGGGIGAAAPSLLQLYGSNLERQAQEGSKDVSRTAALGAAVPGAAAEVASTYIPLGRTFIGKLLGPEAEKALARGTSQSIETAAKESVLATLAKGTAIGAGAEIPTEVGQQMLERLQAGLPLTTPDALREYGESAYGAALVGVPLGAGARALGRPGAREEYKALKQKEEQAAFDAERQAALDKYTAEQTEAQKQRDITREQLGADTSQILALPAPSKEVKPTDEARELINPMGNISRDELAPEVVKHIDTYRKDNGLPRLKSFSVEDVKDAMTQVNPKGEQAALDSILTAKTGYTGEQRYTADDVINAATEKNVATETKGFNDFLARVTGSSNLKGMTQPQLFAAFKALKDMKRADTKEQLVLPEGSNASRYTQKQYDQALAYVKSSFSESGNKPLSTETILTDIKDSTNLETERDAMALLTAAIKNEDLSQSREVVYRTYREGQERPVATYRDKAKADAAAKKQGLNVKEESLVQVAPAEAKVAPETKRAPLPAGYEINESLLENGIAPAEYEITPEGRGKRLTAVQTEGEATEKIPKLQALRAKRAAQMDANIAKSEAAIANGQAQLDRLEADGKADTEQYKVLQAKQASRVKTMNSRIELFKRQKEEFLAPLKAKPSGKKTLTRQAFTVTKDGKSIGTFPSYKAAESHLLSSLSDEELAKTASDTRFGGITDRAAKEQERRKKGLTGNEVEGTKEGLEKAGVDTAEFREKLKALEERLTPMLKKFGLGDVALNVVRAIENNAEGKWAGADKLIQIAFDATAPIKTMRHEALHALKTLGFFTDAQWKALEKQAKDTWVDKYLGGQMSKLGDKVMTRLEAYKQLGYSESEILEEAIADAFGDFETAGKAPPGMLAALFKRMQQFFGALRQALGGAGFESAEEIFGKIERGELEPKQATAAEAEKFALKTVQDVIDDGVERLVASAKKSNLNNLEERYMVGLARADTNLSKIEDGILNRLKDLGLTERVNGTLESEDILHNKILPAVRSRLREENSKKYSLSKPSPVNAWKADEQVIKAADKYEEENGIRPYVSEGFLDLPTDGTKYSLQKYDPKKHLSFDSTLGVPINKDGLITLYYHTTKDQAVKIGNKKVIPSDGRNRIYLTNESNGANVVNQRGNFDQELDGSSVLVYVHPDMLQLDDTEYTNGRKDFFIPLAQGDYFNRKMKLQSIQKARTEAITDVFSYKEHEKKISDAVQKYKDATPSERKKLVAAARAVLKQEHNVSTLLSENGKLEKTRVGDYNLDWDGNSVASMGLGLASAQQISDKVSTCPRSGICEGLCLGETSGGNLQYGGAAAEDVGDIQKSSFRAAARMMQYLKTEALIVHPEEFATILQSEIDSLARWCASETQIKVDKETKKRYKVEKEIYQPAVRLNVTSDFKPEMFRGIIENNPNIEFYDYTKLGSESIADNHHLTYSSTGFGQIVDGEKVFFKDKSGKYDHNWATMRRRLDDGQNVAMAFSSKTEIPSFLVDEETGNQYKVWDGDDYDARFLDPKQADGKGMIIGLRNKAGTLKESTATKETGGFFVKYDPKVDGDTVVVPKQAQFKGLKDVTVTTEKPEQKYSLRKAGKPATRENILGAMQAAQEVQPHMNCQLCVQMATGVAKIRDLPKVQTPKTGDIFVFGERKDMASHYAIDLGNGNVAEVEEWGEQVREVPLANVEEEYGKPDSIRRPPDTAYTKEVTGDKYSLRTYFPTAEEAENAAYEKAPPSTAEFKRFFGASKIMEEGRPQVMYHASPNIFDQFRENKPIFISPSASEAEYYGKRHRTPESMDVNVYPLWVRAETPFDYDNPNHLARLDMYFGDDEVLMGEIADGNWDAIESPEVQDAIISLGHDSFYVNEGKQKNLAVFNANQVKSITGNIGDFSLETKDMRYSLKAVRYSDERFEKLWNDSMYTQNDAENKTKGYLAFVNPLEFVYATASPDTFERLRKEQEPLNFEKMRALAPPSLTVSERDGKWKIIGHEGRHRMLALHGAGYKEVPVYIDFRADNAESIPVKMLTAQDTDSTLPILMAAEVEPLSYANKQKAMEKFTRMNSKVKYSLPPISSGAEGRINATTTVREQDGFVGRLLNAISPESRSYFRQKAINRYNQLSVYDKMLAKKMGGHVLLADQSAESAALMSDLGAGITASALGFGNRMGGIPTYKNGVTTVINSGNQKGLIAALAPLAKYGDPKVYQYYQYWAAVKRGERLYAEGREQLIQPGDKVFANELLQKFPEFEQVQKDFNAFNEGLVKYMVDTGVLSEAQGKEYVKHADYVPFYRQLNEEKTIGPNIFQSISGVKQPRKLKGGEAPLADFLETVVRNTQASIQAGIKNAAAQRAVRVAEQLGPDVGAERLNTVSSAPDVVTVLEKGKQVSYRVADPLFIDAVKSLNMPELPFMSLLSAPSNTLRNLVTKDPGFMMANLMRDSLSAWVTSGQDIKPVIGTIGNFAKALAGKSPGMEKLLNAGVIGGYEFSSVVEASAEKLAKDLDKKYGKATGKAAVLKPFTWVWDALEHGTEASDAATRIAVYERVMQETGNEAEALYRSLEVMNFNRKGSSAVVRILTAAVPFLNARVQGLDVFYRASFGQMATSDAKAIQRAFWVRGMTMMALSSMYFLAVSGSDDYKKQEAETKDNYWIIPGIAKIPAPFEVGVLFKTIPERILAYMFRDDTGQDFKDSLERSLVSTFAFNPIPQAVKPIVEATTNYSFFTMRPIVGQGMEKVAPEFQVGPSTSKLAEMIGKELGLSPMKIDAIMQGYTGTMGMYGVQVIDSILNANSDSPHASKRFEQLPIIKRFALDPEARGNITQYYELKNAVDSLSATSNLLEKSMKPDEWADYMREHKGLFATQEYVRDLEKDMKELREMRRLVQTGSFSPDSKRDYLTTIGQAENNLTKNIQTVKKLISEYQ